MCVCVCVTYVSQCGWSCVDCCGKCEGFIYCGVFEARSSHHNRDERITNGLLCFRKCRWLNAIFCACVTTDERVCMCVWGVCVCICIIAYMHMKLQMKIKDHLTAFSVVIYDFVK